MPPFATSGILGVDLSAVHTEAQFPVGHKVTGSDGNEYIYVQAQGAVAQYAAVALLESGEIVELTTTLSGAVPTTVVFPQIAFADNEYGFAVRAGINFLVLALTLCAADVKLYTTATAGAVDDTATDLIQGLRLNATNSEGSTVAMSASAPNGAYTNAQDA